jgi:hypothetical protein
MNEIYTDLESNNNNNLTKYPSGAVRDTSSGKEDYIESLSFSVLRRFAQYMKTKEDTYGPGNWKKGIPILSYEKSLIRHLQKYFANKYENAGLEPNEDHLAAAMFNLQGIMYEELKGDSQAKA